MIKSALFAVALAFMLGTPAMATDEPPFTVTLTQGAFELRDYPAFVVAEVAVNGNRRAAASKGFRLLAGYIFGGNTRSRKIAMTAPVAQSPAASEKIAMTAPVVQTGAGGSWIVRFVMPHGSTLDNLPRPNDSRVQLRIQPAARLAVVRFSGLAGQNDVTVQTLALERFISMQHLHLIGPPALAQYDPPWVLWFMRRNEIMITVAHTG